MRLQCDYKAYANGKDLSFVVFNKACLRPMATLLLVDIGSSCHFERPSPTKRTETQLLSTKLGQLTMVASMKEKKTFQPLFIVCYYIIVFTYTYLHLCGCLFFLLFSLFHLWTHRIKTPNMFQIGWILNDCKHNPKTFTYRVATHRIVSEW